MQRLNLFLLGTPDQSSPDLFSPDHFPTHKEMASALSQAIAESTIAKLESSGIDHWAESDEFESEVSALARKLFGRAVELQPRQRSRSKRLRQHDTLNVVVHREELSTGKPHEQAILADPDVFPPQRKVALPASILTNPTTPINHESSCTGYTEDLRRQELGVPSIWDDCYKGRAVADHATTQLSRPIKPATAKLIAYLHSTNAAYASRTNKAHKPARKTRAKHLRKLRRIHGRNLAAKLVE